MQKQTTMTPSELIAQVRSGLVQISLERQGERLGSGSGFLVEGGIVTNSHVIRPAGKIDAITLRLADTDSDDSIRLLPENCYQAVAAESPENEKDYAFLRLSEPEFENRYRFLFEELLHLVVGEQVVFLGFPLDMSQLTAHIGYISSIFDNRYNIRTIQIDGSVNGGNSGGPLLNLNGKVIGIVTRAVTGLIEEQFKTLIQSLRDNQIALQSAQRIMRLGSIDPIKAIQASQSAMEQIAVNLQRSANVGIGYAYSAEYIRKHIQCL